MKIKRSQKQDVLKIFLLLRLFFAVLSFPLGATSQDEVESSKHLTKENAYFVLLKVEGFSSEDIPYLKMHIEDKTIPAKIDLGYDGVICLPSHILKELTAKKFMKHVRTYTYALRGTSHEADVYEVGKIDIGNVSFLPVRAEEENLKLKQQDTHLEEKEEKSEQDLGKVGWCLFYNFNLLVDCKHSALALCDSLETLKQQGYPVDSFVEIPFLLDRRVIEFEAMTEAGKLRCMLDTGSHWNELNKDLKHSIPTSKNGGQSLLNPENENQLTSDRENIQEVAVFNIGGKNFGPMTFDRIDSFLAIDAVLGMEFFHSTLVFIDFSNRKLYFFPYPPEEKVLITLDEMKNIQALFNQKSES